MNTKAILVVVLAVAMALGISIPLAGAYMGSPQGFLGYGSGMMGTTQQGGINGMMGGSYSYRGGMMGQGSMMGRSYGAGIMGQGMMGGGMMNGNGNPGSCAQSVQNPSSSQGCRYSGSNGPVVVISNYGFYPQSMTIKVGTTVTWINMDFVSHTVTSGTEQNPTNLFDSHEFGHMQSFSYTFSTPGTYTYFCDIHPYMVGTITVV